MSGIVVTIERATPRTLAAVRREVRIGEIASAWKPALDRVWAFVRSQPGLHAGGHNVFLYHHGAERNAPMSVDFGVEVTRSFDRAGDVFATQTPAGEVAQAVHVGSYARLASTHEAIHAFCASHRKTIAGTSWEIYGDWTDDEAKLETTVVYLLK